MKKIYLSLLCLLFLCTQFSFAQTITVHNAEQSNRVLDLPVEQKTPFITGGTGNTLDPGGFLPDRCGYVTQFNQMVAQGYDKAAFEAIINSKVAEIKAARANGTARFAATYVIPVVFHIIHDGSAEGVGPNLAASQVYEQIDQLNKDFGNLSGSPFPQAADAGISFCPVTVDPNGNTLAQPGINRINRIDRGWTDPTTFGSSTAQVNAMMNYINSTIKPNSIWDPTRYVNVWAYNFSNSGLLGYATFPTAGLPDLPAGETATTAGCVFLSGSLGSVASPGTAGNYALGRTVGHEIGHFLGLYHIWGDVTSCGGTDYCDDTPPCSDRYFSTYPTCTAPVQCSNTRMIQNYMDYSDDGCMNTFTQNQVDRMQAVMLSAPRRPSNSSLCTPPVANALNFTSASTTATENSALTTCPKYTDYAVSVKPAVAASGNATVNFNFSGTATQGSDYSIIGSTTLNYTNGDAATKGFTVRIFDDAAAESSETIIISYTISNSGLVNGVVNTHTITIADNDVTSAINVTSPTVTLLSENFGTATNNGALPAGWLKGAFTAGANVFTVNNQYGDATGFTAADGRVLHITNGTTGQQNGETATNTYSMSSTTNYIAITPAINTLGYKNIKVTFDYACVGELVSSTLYDFGRVRYTITSQTTGLTVVNNPATSTPYYFYSTPGKTSVTLTLPAAVANVSSFWLGFEWYNDNNGTGTNPPFTIDNVMVTGEVAGVETVLNQSVTATQNSGQTAQYISSTNNILATITNLNQNVGCITATVTSTGTGTTTVNTTSSSYLRSNKVIQVTPATANTTATYQLTLYYTTAELATWGSSVPSLKVLKVTDGTNLSSTLSSSNAVIYTPVVNDLRSTAGYASFTINVTGGFSQFMLASANIALPVNLLTFEARPNGKNILLNWSTASEINNRGFVVERSTDAVHFERIGWVDGFGNSSVERRYLYTDNFVQPEQLYYYRLRQADIDNRESFSQIRSAKIKGQSISLSISPNPAKGQVRVFTMGNAALSDINLYDAKGSLIQSWRSINCSTSPYLLDISKIASGIYMIQVKSGDNLTIQKLIINQ